MNFRNSWRVNRVIFTNSHKKDPRKGKGGRRIVLFGKTGNKKTK